MISACWRSNPPSGSMAPEKLAAGTGAAYVDRLTPASIRGMMAAGVSRIFVLDELDSGQRRHISALDRKGIKVEEAKFLAGHLRNPDGESVYLASRRLAGELALVAARKVIDAQPLLKRLNTSYRRETLRLSLAKVLSSSIEPCLLRAQAARALSHPAPVNLWLAEPALFAGDLLRRDLMNVQLRFYHAQQSRIAFLIVKLVKAYIVHTMRLVGIGIGSARQPPQGSLPSVLMVQEDNIRSDRSLRGQPHWLDYNAAPPIFRTYIADLLPFLQVAEDAKKLPDSTLALIGAFGSWAAWVQRKTSLPLRNLAKDGRALRRAALTANGFAETAALLHASQLFLKAERIGALAAYFKTGVFLTHQLSADPIQLVADEMNIRTIAFQYSNIGFLSPLILSTSDCYVIFSDMYKAVLERDGIGPKEWIVGGYVHDQVAGMVRGRANAHRDALSAKGARFVACYFDESVQNDKWGLVSKDDHLAELHELARAVLEDGSFGVVIKSQFIMNSPSRLYPGDTLIQGAKATGRFLELMAGKHRNDVYPVEAALVADICISHKFGATAALEAAMAGVRTVMVDRYGSKTQWDAIYAKANIQYQGMAEVMQAISRYRSGIDSDQPLGDWSLILHHFDPYRDGGAAGRLKKVIEQSVVASVGQ